MRWAKEKRGELQNCMLPIRGSTNDHRPMFFRLEGSANHRLLLFIFFYYFFFYFLKFKSRVN